MLRTLRLASLLLLTAALAASAAEPTKEEKKDEKPKHTNRLAEETSPYLLQHAHNPVDWYPWGGEAFAAAKSEEKPVLLSVGYSACHWCHVMERESFEDAETAQLMNELYVSVKVDREERPDVDAVYMDAVVALSGHGGWPMTVFLLPNGEPFFGGTYYPPEPRHGLPAFRQVLDAMAAGGMYDLVGGGFHRYSVDEQWLVPHFEKMLYDNALLIPAYLHGWLLTGEDRYRRVVEQTVEYALRELRLEGGGFASAQDADTDGVEGLTFTWTPDELDRDDLLLPFEHGQYILRGELSDAERAQLLATRQLRPQPLRDDKAIAAWNGLMLAALAEAGRRLERDDWLDAARELAEFLLGSLSDGERLHRTWRDR